MRGELVNVWEETFREIWAPLADEEDVPSDLFSELYGELVLAFKVPVGEEIKDILLADAIQLRQAFEHALSLSGVEVEFAIAEDAFKASGVTNLDDSRRREAAVESCLAEFLGGLALAKQLLARALSEFGEQPLRLEEAKARALDKVLNDRFLSRQAFELVSSSAISGERALVKFLEASFAIIHDMGGDALSNKYFNLLARFIEKFSLRYDLRRPCVFCPTLPGVFASLVRDLRVATSGDAHLDALMKDFENAIRDLRTDNSDGRIKTCIQKQMNLLEAIGRECSGVTGTTLGVICNQIQTWPHEKVKDAMKALYGFASDYPGIRHGGTPANAIRAVDMRDMVAMSILLAGFTPYLSNAINADIVYRGA